MKQFTHLISCLLCLLLSVSCATHRPPRGFRVLPAAPDYLLRSPDSVDTPFAETLHAYNGFETHWVSVNLRPKMELRVENAYFREGVPKPRMDDFLGTESALYEVPPQGGLRLRSVHLMENRPRDQPSIKQLIPASQRDYRYQRFYFEVGFNRNGNTRSSVLLGANSIPELDTLANQMISNPGSVCYGKSAGCTVFPEACSVSVEMEIVMNGIRRSVLWGSVLRSISGGTQHLQLERLYQGKLTPVILDPLDPNALRLPLLPGDHLKLDP